MGKTAHNASKHFKKEVLSWERKAFWVLGLALLGAVAIAGMGFTGCHRPPMFCGGGFGGENFPKHVLEKIDSEVEDLNLTETQQAQYRRSGSASKPS
jgi:hypothetical protein